MKKLLLFLVFCGFMATDVTAQEKKRLKSVRVSGAGGDSLRVYVRSGDRLLDTLITGRSIKAFEWPSNGWEDMGHPLFKRKFDFDKLREDLDLNFRVFSPDFVSSSFSLYGIKVYTNKPNKQILNVGFKCDEESDVSVVVLDLDGNKVASKKVEGIKGEYFEQLDLGENAEGNHVVMIRQGDAVITRTVKI